MAPKCLLSLKTSNDKKAKIRQLREKKACSGVLRHVMHVHSTFLLVWKKQFQVKTVSACYHLKFSLWPAYLS